jgi:DNA polymerase bacteriophage-type
MQRCWWDSETYSPVEISHGTYAYSEAVEVMLWAWAIDDGPAYVWDKTAGEPCPSQLADAVADDSVIFIAHNAIGFDKVVADKDGIRIPLHRWRCTAAQARSHSLPGALDKLCDIFRLSDDKAKMKDSKALIQLFCKPRPKNHKLRRATRFTHPEEWKRFKEYAAQDVVAMREVSGLMPKWNYPR